MTEGARVVSRLTENVILVDAGLHALNSRAIACKSGIRSDFCDIVMSLDNRMLKHVPNLFNDMFISLYVISQKLCRLQRRLTSRHRASCILGQAFRYSPENAFYILINKYISLSDTCLTVYL